MKKIIVFTLFCISCVYSVAGATEEYVRDGADVVITKTVPTVPIEVGRYHNLLSGFNSTEINIIVSNFNKLLRGIPVTLSEQRTKLIWGLPLKYSTIIKVVTLEDGKLFTKNKDRNVEDIGSTLVFLIIPYCATFLLFVWYYSAVSTKKGGWLLILFSFVIVVEVTCSVWIGDLISYSGSGNALFCISFIGGPIVSVFTGKYIGRDIGYNVLLANDLGKDQVEEYISAGWVLVCAISMFVIIFASILGCICGFQNVCINQWITAFALVSLSGYLTGVIVRYFKNKNAGELPAET